MHNWPIDQPGRDSAVFFKFVAGRRLSNCVTKY